MRFQLTMLQILVVVTNIQIFHASNPPSYDQEIFSKLVQVETAWVCGWRRRAQLETCFKPQIWEYLNPWKI